MQIEIFRDKNDLNKFLEQYRESIIVAYIDTKIKTQYDPEKKQFLNFYFFILQYEYIGQRLPESLKNDPKLIDPRPITKAKMEEILPPMPPPQAFGECCVQIINLAQKGQ